MQILLPIVSAVDALQDPAVLPPIDDVRPAICPDPDCGHAAFGGVRLGIVGHGAYSRGVLGIPDADRAVRVPVRRFRCRGCGGTISVLPDLIHPRRWWGAWAILEVLVLHLVQQLASAQIAARFELALDEPVWRTPGRWRRQLLHGLWPWWAQALGSRGPAMTAEMGRRRLERLFAQAGRTTKRVTHALAARVAATLARKSVHSAGRSWWATPAPRGPRGKRGRS